ncbi:MAG: hypothetical protein U5L09_12955 [Bacteroidales bacterium]|nr:hypothetical protein [Bacteroidales bacterium]
MFPDEYFFIGFIFYFFTAGYLSVFAPVNNHTIIYFASFLFLLFLFKKTTINHEIKGLIQTLNIKQNRAVFLVLAGLVLSIAAIAANGINHHDTGLYHAQSIKWIQNYPVVPGLGNLHHRLAFNSMLFPVEALFSVNYYINPLDTKIIIYPLSALVSIVVFSRLFYLVFLETRNRSFSGWKFTFYLLVLVLSLNYLLIFIASPAPDTITAILVIYILIDSTHKNYTIGYKRLLFFFMLALAALTIKLSYLFAVLFLIPMIGFKPDLKRF